MIAYLILALTAHALPPLPCGTYLVQGALKADAAGHSYLEVQPGTTRRQIWGLQGLGSRRGLLYRGEYVSLRVELESEPLKANPVARVRELVGLVSEHSALEQPYQLLEKHSCYH